MFEKNFAPEIALLTPPAPPPISTTPGQWRHNSISTTPNGIVTNGIAIGRGSSTPINTSAGVTQEDTLSALNTNFGTVGSSGQVAHSARGRITSMIFGSKHHGSHHQNEANSATTTHSALTFSGTTAANTPIDPTPSSTVSSGKLRSRSGSLSNSLSRTTGRKCTRNITPTSHYTGAALSAVNSNSTSGKKSVIEEEGSFLGSLGRRPSTTSSIGGGLRPPGSSGSLGGYGGREDKGGTVERVGSVRKRFSLKKLGRKASKISVGSGGVIEED